jgi:hypothetical protein
MRKKGRRALRQIETLEARQLMAGDVTVAVVNGNLLIHGDDAANHIAITSGETAGSYLIRGLEGTTIKPAAAGPKAAPIPESGLMVTGVRREVAIRMGAGDDVVRIDNATFRGHVSIGADGGADRIVIGSPAEWPTGEMVSDVPVNAAGVRGGQGLTIATGADDDHVRIDNANFRGHVTILTAGGNDNVVFGQRPPSTDPATVRDVESRRPDVRGGQSILVRTGEGDDRVVMHRTSAGRGVVVDLGMGDDRVNLTGVVAGQVLSIQGGVGADRVNLAAVRAERAAIHTGAGADHVQVIDSAFALLDVSLGEGDDSLSLGGVKARLLVAAGGPGEDTLVRLSENLIASRRLRNFEPLSEEPAPPTTAPA